MSPRLAPFLLAVSIGSLAPVHAEDPAAAPKVPPYVLKNRSTFTAVSDDQRAPFWPIGWTKRRATQGLATAPVRAVETPKVVLDEKSFKVTSILVGNPSLAIINGRTYSEGEFMRMPRTAVAAGTAPAPAARVRVYRINDGQVVLQNEDQLIPVALQRPEMVRRSDVEVLLTEDRP